MAKDEDLKILGAIVVTGADKETGERPNDQAEEEQHRRILGCGQSRIRVFDPHGRFAVLGRMPTRSAASGIDPPNSTYAARTSSWRAVAGREGLRPAMSEGPQR